MVRLLTYTLLLLVSVLSCVSLYGFFEEKNEVVKDIATAKIEEFILNNPTAAGEEDDSNIIEIKIDGKLIYSKENLPSD